MQSMPPVVGASVAGASVAASVGASVGISVGTSVSGISVTGASVAGGVCVSPPPQAVITKLASTKTVKSLVNLNISFLPPINSLFNRIAGLGQCIYITGDHLLSFGVLIAAKVWRHCAAFIPPCLIGWRRD